MNNDMTYSGNGTGTQADPYQVTTIEQLLECFDIYNHITSSYDDIYLYCKLMNDLDFNDDPKYWDCPSNLFYASNMYGLNNNPKHTIYIDGNGYGIYNLYCYNKQDIFNVYCSHTSAYGSQANNIVIQNLIFEAIAIHTSDNCSLFVEYYNSTTYFDSGIRFINCDLRIKYYSYWYQNERHLLGSVTQFTNCILNIDIVLNTQGYTPYTRGSLLTGRNDISSNNAAYRNMYNEWKIRVIMVSEPTGPSGDSGAYNKLHLFLGTAHLFSSFFIELLAMKGNAWQICTSNPEYNNPMSIMNCYFVIKNITTLSPYKATLRIGAVKNGVNFYDATADNIADGSTGGGSLLALTTEQCKDAEYLESQGFIIAK
jgi:hypothetical protein